MSIKSKEEIDSVMNEAQCSFWDIVASSFPNITSGDFSPEQTIKFDLACTNAITHWLENNDQNRTGLLDRGIT